MSTEEKLALPTVWLSVSFDADQAGAQLVWLVSENRENLYEPYGPFAGSLRLPKNCHLSVEVRGYGSETLLDFAVESAVLVTVPTSLQCLPSPFAGQDVAVTQLGPFAPVKAILFDPHLNRAYGITAITDPLDIGNEDGGWNLSMVLTVSIRTRTIDSDAITVSRRVFRFDPESYVGNGTRPEPGPRESRPR